MGSILSAADVFNMRDVGTSYLCFDSQAPLAVHNYAKFPLRRVKCVCVINCRPVSDATPPAHV